MSTLSLLPRPSIPFIPSWVYARGGDWITTLGYDRGALLRRARIEAETMESVDGLLTLTQVEAFITGGLEMVGQPGRVIEFGNSLLFPSFGDVGLAVLTAPNVAAAFATTRRFFDLLTPLLQFEHTRHGEYDKVLVALRYGLHADALRVHIAVVVSCVAAIVRTGAASSLEGFVVDLPIDDPRLVGWATERGATVRTGADAVSIRIPSSVATKPFVLADPRVHETYVARCAQSLANRRVEDQTVRTVRGQLREAGPPFPDLDTLSRKAGASSRTIRRRLEREGVSYRELLDEARFSWAAAALRSPENNITSVAYDLGFESPEAFSRAFRRRLGRSPSAYRTT